MRRIVVKKNGKSYLVTVPGTGGAGDDGGVGPGVPVGTLWLFGITDNNWYAVNVFGPSGSVEIYVNPTTFTWPSNDSGYQLLYNYSDGNVYQTYLSGSGIDADVLISQTPWSNPNDYKPYLLLQSITDSYFYKVYASGSAGSVELVIDQNGIWMGGGTPPVIPPAEYYFRITEDNFLRITEDGSYRIV